MDGAHAHSGTRLPAPLLPWGIGIGATMLVLWAVVAAIVGTLSLSYGLVIGSVFGRGDYVTPGAITLLIAGCAAFLVAGVTREHRWAIVLAGLFFVVVGVVLLWEFSRHGNSLLLAPGLPHVIVGVWMVCDLRHLGAPARFARPVASRDHDEAD